MRITLLSLLAGMLILPAQAQDTDKNFYLGGSIGYSDLAVDDPATDYPPAFWFFYPDIPAIRSDNYEVDDKTTGWSLYGGYLFSRFFGIEAGYTDIGEPEINQDSSYIFTYSLPGGFITTAPGYTTSLGWVETHTQEYIARIQSGTRGYQLSGIAWYPLSERFSLYGKMGVIRSNNVLEKQTTISYSIVASSSGFPDVLIVPFPRESGSESHSNTSLDMTFGLGTEYYVTENIAIRGQWQQYRIRNEWDQYGIKMKNNINTYTLGMNYRFGF